MGINGSDPFDPSDHASLWRENSNASRVNSGVFVGVNEGMLKDGGMMIRYLLLVCGAIFLVGGKAMSPAETYLTLCREGGLEYPSAEVDEASERHAKVVGEKISRSEELLKRENATTLFYIARAAFRRDIQLSDAAFERVLELSVKGGDVRAAILFAEYELDRQRDVEGALALLRCTRKKGSAYAAAVLANYLLFVKEENLEEGIGELVFAAENGQALSMVQLAGLLKSGKYVAKDLSLRVQLLEQASKMGLVEAKVSLGAAYELGEGVKPDLGEALKYYLDAAASNDSLGCFNAGRLLVVMGRKQDGLVYLKRAEALGVSDATPFIRELERGRSRE